MKLFSLLIVFFSIIACSQYVEQDDITWPENIQVILDNTTYLEYDRDNRLPLFLWPAINPGKLNDRSIEILVNELNKRGIGIVSSWNMTDKEENLLQCITIGKAQKKLGQMININATSLLYGFYLDDESTAHIDENGNYFFDDSFDSRRKMGCPFTLDSRKNEIRDRVNYFLSRYKKEGLSVDFIFADWEIDGPIEVNHAYESSKRCTRCRKHLGENFSFGEFQKAMREMRSYLQYYTYSLPVLSYFPDALIGNYAVYPNDGYRYWYDYFEFLTDNHPYKTEQKAAYRQWYNDFPLTGYTFAMPVVYPWWEIFTWYDFENLDYRWFYNMLLNASNAGKSTTQNTPIIPFVHWNTVFSGVEPDPSIIQMSKNSYQELLWHMLLRGSDTFFMWCKKTEFAEETRLVHEVYAAAQQYGDFLEKGWPITFDIPDNPGVIISGLALGDSVLVRRTDFCENREPVEILVGTKTIKVHYMPDKCGVIALNE